MYSKKKCNLIVGNYFDIKEYCNEEFDDYFEFSLMFNGNALDMQELNRWLYESRKQARFKNYYSGPVIVNLSCCNEHSRKDDLAKAFMFFISDYCDENELVFVLENHCDYNSVQKFIEDFFCIENRKEINLKPKAKTITIGFAREVN